jgi:hypothetical protein
MSTTGKLLLEISPRYRRLTAKQQLAVDAVAEKGKYCVPYTDAELTHAAGVITEVCFAMASIRVVPAPSSSQQHQ